MSTQIPTSPKRRTGRDRLAAGTALLVALSALPVVALVIPNTTQYVIVQGLGLGDGQDISLIRAAGLTLPALLLTVPLAAVAVRRLPAWLVLTLGLCCALGGVLAIDAVATVPLIGAARVAQGAGAGMILPATLVLVWERRRRALTALWAGALAAALLLAMPLALRSVPVATEAAPAPDAWRTVLQPYPWIIGIALAAAAVCALAQVRAGGALPALRHTERTQLLLPVVPAAGFAVLAIMTTYGWSPGAQLLVAGIALAALLGLALVGSRDATTGSPFGCAVVMVTVGLLIFPVATPLSGLIGASTGPRGVPLVPFAAGAAAALFGALASVPLSGRDGRGARGTVMAGHGLALISLLVFLTVDATSDQWLLLAPLVPLGAGVGMALAASLREAGPGAALFGLALCFPAVLTGQMAVSALQSGQLRRLDPISTNGQLVYGLTAGYRIWLIVAGVITVVLVGAVAIAGRRRAPAGDTVLGEETAAGEGTTPAEAGDLSVAEHAAAPSPAVSG